MIAPRRRIATLALALAGAATVMPGMPAWAQIQAVPAVTVTAGGAYSTNPFLEANGNGGGAASTQVDVRPSVTLIDGTETAVVSANYNRADFFNDRFGSNSGYGIGASANSRLSPRTSIGVNASFDSAILGANMGFITPGTIVPTLPPAVPGLDGGTVGGIGTGGAGAGTGAVAPVVPVAPSLPSLPGITPLNPTGIDGDVGLIGARQRRNQWLAGATVDHIISPRTNVNLGVNASRATYPGAGNDSLFLSDFRTYGGNLGITRSLTEVSSVGFQLLVNYAQFGNGFDSQIYSPRITYSRTLSERWNLAAGVGAGISRDQGRTSTTVAFDGSLCRTGERTNGCITAARVPTVTGFGGVRVQTTVGANFAYRFNSRMSAGLAGAYSHVEAIDDAVSPVLAQGSQDLFSGDFSLQRQLGRRLSAVGSVSYRRGNGFLGSGVDDVTGRLGLSLAIGRFQ